MHGLLIAGGVGPCPLLCALPRTHGLGARQSAVAAIACTACVQQVQRGARDVHGLLIAALTATHGFGSTSHSVLYLPCAVPVAADLEQMTQPERHCSGSGSDASRSAIARVDSKCG